MSGSNDLRAEVIFPDHRAVPGFDAGAGDAWTRSLGRPVDRVDMDGIEVEQLLDSARITSVQGKAPKIPPFPA